MKKFQNVSPIGALDIPSLNRVVEAGEEFEVPDDLVEVFGSQPGNFAEVQGPKPRKGRSKTAPTESTDGADLGETPTVTGDTPVADADSTDEEEEASR